MRAKQLLVNELPSPPSLPLFCTPEPTRSLAGGIWGERKVWPIALAWSRRKHSLSPPGSATKTSTLLSMAQAKEVCEGKETLKSRLFPPCWFYNPETSFTTACILKESCPHGGGDERKYCIYLGNNRVWSALLTMSGDCKKKCYLLDRYQHSFEFQNFDSVVCTYLLFLLCALKVDVIFRLTRLTANNSHMGQVLFLFVFFLSCNSAPIICRWFNFLITDVETMTWQ